MCQQWKKWDKFDHSQSASAIYQNNTIFFNGVHEIIQDLSVADGNPAQRAKSGRN